MQRQINELGSMVNAGILRHIQSRNLSINQNQNQLIRINRLTLEINETGFCHDFSSIFIEKVNNSQ